ncbi:MAG TPA: phosphatase PAP2 family protein [Polyangiaceae bacterium]|nr:phosphatase PAP2 family protein [Polyangiaceae bacterium]
MLPRFVREVLVAVSSSFLLAGTAQADSSSVRWNPDWPRFRPSEYALTAGLALNVAQAVFLYPAPQTNWDGGILFDDAVRDALLLKSRDGRQTAATVSDDIYYALAVYPLLVDNAVVTWGVHGASDVAFQMMLMNFESYALTGVVSLSAEKLGRVRPMGRECTKDASYDGKCGNQANLNASFLSGHTAIGFAGAGLMCAHHTHLPLYGSRVADVLACVTALAAATTGGVLRVMSDNHYASDVLLGTGVGLFGGYVWPMLWHYGFGSKEGRAASFLPQVHTKHGGLAISGALLPQIGPTAIGITLALDVSSTPAPSPR